MQLPLTPAAEWITSRDALEQWLAAIPADAALDLDTEFMRRNTFYPQLALLQLGWNKRYALVDPLAFDIGDALRPLLGNGQSLTVMHSGSEDLEALAPLLPGGPAKLFDTQIAAAFVGMGLGISYRALVAELVGAELDKGETRSDWMQRPLTDSQRAYATLDVVHLEPVREQLAERLDRRGRTAWHMEDCERLKRRACVREGDPQPQESFRGASEWHPAQQARLRRILLWRDATAREQDRPRPWLLEDAQAMNLAQLPPQSMTELDSRTRGQRALRTPQRTELFHLLQQPITDDDLAATNPIPGTPQGEAKKALATMKDVVDATALELDLPAGLLCSRKVLENYVVTRQWPDLLEGWRRDFLHQQLSSRLPG